MTNIGCFDRPAVFAGLPDGSGVSLKSRFFRYLSMRSFFFMSAPLITWTHEIVDRHLTLVCSSLPLAERGGCRADNRQRSFGLIFEFGADPDNTDLCAPSNLQQLFSFHYEMNEPNERKRKSIEAIPVFGACARDQARLIRTRRLKNK